MEKIITKKIIAPTDFSTTAENACIYAVNLAADIKAELLVSYNRTASFCRRLSRFGRTF